MSKSKTKKPLKLKKSSKKTITACPDPQEINTLAALFNEGRYAEAVTFAQAMTIRFPLDGFGWKVLGAAFKLMGRTTDALEPMQKAALLSPGDADTHSNLGSTLQELGRLAESEVSCRRALQINPDYAEAHNNLSITLRNQGRLDEAEASCRRALQIRPDYAEANNNLGNILSDLGRLGEAEASCRRALLTDPDYVEAHNNLAAIFHQLGRLDEAEASCRRALQIRPDYAEAHNNLGNTLQELGRINEAEACCRRALENGQDFAEAHNNLGNTLQKQSRLDEAEAGYRRALEINPDFAEAHSNLGGILKDLGWLDEAEACCRRALEINPDSAEAHNNLGATLYELGRLTESGVSYRRALQIKPDYGSAHQNFSTLLAYLSDFEQVVTESNTALHLRPNDAILWEQRLYSFSYHPDLTAQEIYGEFVRWGDRFPDPVTDFSAHDRTPGRRLKIGYVSPDFRRHTSRFFFLPLFANHDPVAVELYAYSNVKYEDDVTQEFKGLFDYWRNIRTVSDRDVADLIRRDGIDILVDCCNHMRDDRLAVFALKPAPIQATWLGAAWTTGLKAVDYALIDPYMAPEGTLARETIVRLPHCFVAYRPPEETAQIAQPPCLNNGYITFGYTGRTERLNHHTFRVWGEILRQNPAARLILDFGPFADPSTQTHYRQLMARHGMDSGRVIMRKSDNIFAGLNDIDILLDSFPHSGGTMLFDALWMGAPVLTLAGRPPVGRIGASLMINLGLSEWVAESHEDYISKACAFAHNPQALAQLRAGMRERMQNSPVMDEPGFARAMETAYRDMFDKWTNAGMNQTCMNAGTLTVEHNTVNLSTEKPSLAEENWVRESQNKEKGLFLSTLPPEGKEVRDLNSTILTLEQTLQQAVAHHQAGQVQDAERCYRAILQVRPNHSEANHNLGVLAVQMKQPVAGLPHFMIALENDPTHKQYWLSYLEALIQADMPEAARQVLALGRQQGVQGDEIDALAVRLEGDAQTDAACQFAIKESILISQSMKKKSKTKSTKPDKSTSKMGNNPTSQETNALAALFNEGRYAETAILAEKMTVSFPLHGFGWMVLGAVFKQMGRITDALIPMQKAAALSSNDADAHSNLGVTLKELGWLNEAEASYRRALQIKPDYAEAHNNLGNTLFDLGRLDEAEISYRRALEIAPDYAKAHSNLGNTLRELGRLDEAEVAYRRALEIKSDYAEAHNNLGYTLMDQGRLGEAEASCRRALQIKPDYAEALSNLSGIFHELGRLNESEANCRRALEIKPDFAVAHYNLGNVLNDLGRLKEAEVSYRQALQIKPDYAEAYNNLGATLKDLGQLIEAEAGYRRALQIKPDYASARQNLAMVFAYLSDFGQVVAESNAALHLKPNDAMIWEQRLYSLSYHPDLTAQEIYGEFVRWGDRFPDPVTDFSTHDRTQGRRLKIGYVSPDFRRHTSRFFFQPLFANHDHSVVELYAYSNVKLEDDVTQEFKGIFDQWRNIRSVADSDVAQMIRQDKIDILVDCCNHMRDDRLGVFALKPAPIQATWLGAAWTTGLKAVDYALIDPYMAPEGTLARETIVRLPHCFVAYRPPEETAEIAPPPCLNNGYITFGYTGRTERLNHHTFRVWGEILRQNPTARLILDFGPFADPSTQAHYRQLMARHGMDAGRVIMRKSDNIFAGLNDIDILLDSFPHSGGTMLFDALWMGVPILTLTGRPPVGRIGASLMSNLELPEWVAESHEDYIAKACTFAQNTRMLAQLRASMRERMQNSSIMDEPGFARAMETAYRDMFENWMRG